MILKNAGVPYTPPQKVLQIYFLFSKKEASQKDTLVVVVDKTWQEHKKLIKI